MLYDSILLVGVVFVCFLPSPILSETFRLSTAGIWVSRIYFLLILFLFFGWFWTHRGQTLGMRAWRIKVICDDGQDLTWKLALKRYLFAMLSFLIFGIGFIWSIFHPRNMTLHDLYSGSKIIMLEKRKKSSGNSPQQ